MFRQNGLLIVVEYIERNAQAVVRFDPHAAGHEAVGDFLLAAGAKDAGGPLSGDQFPGPVLVDGGDDRELGPASPAHQVLDVGQHLVGVGDFPSAAVDQVVTLRAQIDENVGLAQVTHGALLFTNSSDGAFSAPRRMICHARRQPDFSLLMCGDQRKAANCFSVSCSTNILRAQLVARQGKSCVFSLNF